MQNPPSSNYPMNKPRILLALVWLGSLAAAYFIGSVGDYTPHPLPSISAEAAAPGATARSTPIPHARAGAAADETKEAKPDIRLLIAQARLAMGSTGGMMNIRAMLRAIAPLAELDDAQLQEALGEVEKEVREPQQKMMLYSLLLGQWAETDGRAAMTYAQAKLEKGSMFEMGVTASVLGTWAHHDPEAAWKWFATELPDDGGRTRMVAMHTIFAALAATNLEAAFARVGTLDESARGTAIEGIASSVGDDAARRRLLARAASLPPEISAQFRQSLMSQWTMTNPDEAVAWFRALPAEEQKPLRSSAGQRLLNVKPALGAEILLEGAEEKDRPQLYDMVASQWAYMDARGAGEWLTKQPQGPELDGARASYSRVIAQRDPAAAMDWARAVQGEQQRTESVTAVYQMWRMKDAPAAEAALTAAGLPAAQLKQIREAPSPQATGATPAVRSYGK